MTIERVFSGYMLCVLGAIAPMTALGAPTSVSDVADAPPIVEQQTQEQVAGQESAKDPAWVDTSHRFATDRTLALTRWVDGFFGDVDSDTEIAESRLRLKLTTDWDDRLGTETRVSVGGKVNLPQLANRVDLVFRGDDPDELIAG
ncbi:hypothetical protein N9W72_08765, partial [Luminiphilus sp.]|nr:hypothetical protein [Luminiphilus sp.]